MSASKVKCLALDEWTMEDHRRLVAKTRKDLQQMHDAVTSQEMAEAILEHTVTLKWAITWAEGMAFMGKRVELHEGALAILEAQA